MKVKENDEAIINKWNGGKESFSQSILPNLESTQKYKHNGKYLKRQKWIDITHL